MQVKTKYGIVEGREAGGMLQFFGIPYAKTPTGELRFRPPVAPDSWDGVRKAWNYEARCPQPRTPNYVGHYMVGDYLDGPPESEDCLYLNIWTSGLEGAKRPVVVMIHGGGSYIGAARSDYSDGQHFCGGRDAVFVSFNWRLGPFGFLYLGDVLGDEYETSGSLGFMDQIAALEWIHENIAAFGGDPDNVTIMGQSAGAKSVGNIIVSPRGKGLFRRAIMESGAIQCIRDKKTASAVTRAVLEEYGLKPEEAAKVLTMPTQELVDGFYRFLTKNPQSVGPVFESVNFPMSPQEYLDAGNANGIEVLIGYNRCERGIVPAAPQSFEKRVDYLNHRYGKNAPHILEVYKDHLRTMPEYEAWGTLMTEYNYGTASREFAYMLATSGAKVYCYRWDFFDEGTPVHCSELRYVYRFASTENPMGYLPQNAYMAKIMNDSWNAFAATGSPQIPELPEWTPYTNATNGKRMYLSKFPSAEYFDLNEYDHDYIMQEIILD